MEIVKDLLLFALQSLPEAFIIVDIEHKIRYINPFAARLLQIMDTKSLMGQPFTTIPGGTGLMTYEQKAAFYYHINELAITEVAVPSIDEQKWSVDIHNHLFNFLATPIYDDNQEQAGYVVQITKIGEERNTHEMFSALLSEIYIPITIINGYARLLLDKQITSLTDEHYQWLSEIDGNSKKLLELRETAFTKLQNKEA
jgi:nitrogen-specific signal transduction histidine kinase